MSSVRIVQAKECIQTVFRMRKCIFRDIDAGPTESECTDRNKERMDRLTSGFQVGNSLYNKIFARFHAFILTDLQHSNAKEKSTCRNMCS